MSTPETWELDGDAARVALGEWIAREAPSDEIQRRVSAWLVESLGPDPFPWGEPKEPDEPDEPDVFHDIVPGTNVRVVWLLDGEGLLVKPVIISMAEAPHDRAGHTD